MTATKTRRTLTPVDITARFRSFNGGRLENWAAVSRDGEWKYERLEISGTPWQVEHVPSGTIGHWYGSLDKARAATANGSALAWINLLLDHERGEHETERNPCCGRC